MDGMYWSALRGRFSNENWIRRGSVGSCVMRAVMLGWSFGGRHLVGGFVDGGFEGEGLWVAADEFRCTAVTFFKRFHFVRFRVHQSHFLSDDVHGSAGAIVVLLEQVLGPERVHVVGHLVRSRNPWPPPRS